MNIPPLCIIQARYHSSRLPGKMLREIGGETLIARAWRVASDAFGAAHCVVAIPGADLHGPLGYMLRHCEARVFAWEGLEADVLSRFHACVHTYRWHPDSVIVRYTPDDHRKEAALLQRVANGERLPVELGGEAFTLAMLDWAHRHVRDAETREHLTYALFPENPPPKAPDGTVWTIDTPEDLERARLEAVTRDCVALQPEYYGQDEPPGRELL